MFYSLQDMFLLRKIIINLLLPDIQLLCILVQYDVSQLLNDTQVLPYEVRNVWTFYTVNYLHVLIFINSVEAIQIYLCTTHKNSFHFAMHKAKSVDL